MELRKNEETGAIEKQVVTYENVERESLLAIADSKEAELNAVRDQGTSLQEQIQANADAQARLESELADAKSGLQQHDSLTGFQPEPVQPEPVSTDTETPGEVEATEVTPDGDEAVNIPVQF